MSMVSAGPKPAVHTHVKKNGGGGEGSGEAAIHFTSPLHRDVAAKWNEIVANEQRSSSALAVNRVAF